MITYLCTYSFFAFNLDNPVAHNSAFIMGLDLLRKHQEYQENSLAALVNPNKNGGLVVSMVFTKWAWFCKAFIGLQARPSTLLHVWAWQYNSSGKS